ncbi:MAG TPA: hypothetical protein VGI39_16220 [Polyangiaceae bacterium]
MRERTPRLREARIGEPARSFQIAITPSDAGRVLGTITVRDLDGQEAHRELRADSCDALAAGLALIAALIVDPAALAAPTEATPAVAPPKSSPPPPARDAPVSPSGSASPANPALRAAAGASLDIITGINPGAAVLPGVFLDLSLPALSPRLRVRASVGRAFSQTSTTVSGTASFTATAARFEPCINVAPDPAGALRLDACGVLEGLVVQAAGTNTTDGQHLDRSWTELGLALRPAWVVGGRVELGLLGGLTAALAQPRFYFGPDTTAYHVATWSALAGATAGVSFW